MLKLSSISKSFGAVQALADVSLEFRAGEIHGLVGENGAGKSTTIKIVGGVHRPDSGEVRLEESVVAFRDCRDSQARGVAIVNQELAVIPDATVAENIMIDKLVTHRAGVIDWRATRRIAQRHMDRVGLAVDPDRLVRGLSVAQKQLVQIAKALSAPVKVLLLDEPTASLTEHETRRLFVLLRELRGEGVAIIFVSHKLDEVFGVCDRVSILRDGRSVGTREIREIDSRELVRLMLGRSVDDDHLGVLNPDSNTEVLRAERISRRGMAREASFVLHRGEILGFYGLVGSGRTELARILIGEEPMDSGRLAIRGQTAVVRSLREAMSQYRLGYVSENRKEEGLFLHDSVERNLTISIWRRLRHPFSRRIDDGACAEIADRWIGSLGIKTRRREDPVGNLSGGNQQKVSIGKWLVADCDVLIIDEPTIGVDIGAKQQIHQLIWNLAAKDHKSLIVISSDLPELVRIVSRLLVFRDQRIVGEVRNIDRERKTYAQVSAEIAPFFE